MQVWAFSPQGDQRAADVADLPALLASENVVVWADATGPTGDDVSIMHDVFRFHPLAIEDAVNQEQRPKAEEYPGHLFLILNTIARQGDELLFHELDVFVGRNFIVTVHAREEPAVKEARKRLSSIEAALPISAAYLLYIVMDAVIDGYFPVLDALGESIEDIENAILEAPRRPALVRLFHMKRTMIELWRVIWPQREILNVLMHHKLAHIEQDALQYYLRDIADHLMWLTDMVNTYRDHLTSITDLYMSAVSNRLNRVVNRLTVYALVIGVSTVITAFYGMNFLETWPPFGASWGVPFVLVFMVALTALLLIVAKRRGWF